MPVLRYLPLKLRLPLIHSALRLLGASRSSRWSSAGAVKPKTGSLVVSAFYQETLGIGRAGRMTAEALKTAGYDVVEHDLRPSFKKLLPGNAALPGAGGVWLIHANAPECRVAFLAHPPASWADRYRIAYWAWETPKAPADWVEVADYLHEIWVPSRYVHEAVAAAFRQAGRDELVSRLRIMPHPAPVPATVAYGEAQTRFGLDPDLCEVLCLFDTKSSATRKNPWGVIDAWQAAFPQASERARLTLKVSDLKGDRATERRLTELVAARPDIRVMSERLSDGEMDALIAACDLMISLHRSEGFGLTLAEAMASGVAVIATGGTGNGDFMNENNARLVPSRPVAIRDPDGPYAGLARDRDQVWGEPDVGVAAEALRDLVEHGEVRRRLADAARRDIRKLSAPWQRDALKAMAFNLVL